MKMDMFVSKRMMVEEDGVTVFLEDKDRHEYSVHIPIAVSTTFSSMKLYVDRMLAEMAMDQLDCVEHPKSPDSNKKKKDKKGK